MLTIVRGTRNVARARGDLAASEVSAPMSRSVRSSSSSSHSNNKRYAGVPRVRGRVSVAVRRDTGTPIAPQPPNSEEAIATSTTYGPDQDGDEADEHEDTWRHVPEAIDVSSLQDNSLSPLYSRGSGGGTSDETTDTPHNVMTAFAFSGNTVPHPDPTASSGTGSEQQSLASWLLPSPIRASSKERRRARPLEGIGSPHPTSGTADVAAFPQLRGRTWTEATENRDGGGRPINSRGASTLSAWLEPREPGCGKKQRKLPGRSVETARDGPDGQSEGEGGDSEKWMSERLGGLDPSGAARAKSSWTDRERRNLTSTDIALGTKRKVKGGRGWRTKSDGNKVFVAPARGGAAVVASGQAAFRMSLSGSKKRVG